MSQNASTPQAAPSSWPRSFSRKLMLLLASGFCLMTVVAAAAIYVGRHYFIHPKVEIDYAAYPVRGIDVSMHNGVIDFGRVKRSGMSFVIMKASEGMSYRDPRFAVNYADARRSGLKVGAYHFFRKDVEGRAQADNFISTLGGRKFDLPLTVDVEDWGNALFADNDTAFIRLKAMVYTLKNRGYSVMVYTNGKGYKKYVSRLNSHDYLWLCSFNSPDSLRRYGHHIQQFSHWGSVDGVKGDVDLDVFVGSRREWQQWVGTYAVQ